MEEANWADLSKDEAAKPNSLSNFDLSPIPRSDTACQFDNHIGHTGQQT
jgi:hypothetical protein